MLFDILLILYEIGVLFFYIKLGDIVCIVGVGLIGLFVLLIV